MPPLEFGHTAFEPRRRHFIPITGIDLPPSSLADPSYELADLLGDGLPDILQMNGSVRYWRNLGGGRFDLPRPMSEAPAGLQLADQGVQLLDADGDGRVDLLVTTPTISGYFPMGSDGLWDRRAFHRYQVAPSFNLEDPEVRLVDLNGDGVTDALRSSTRFDCFFNDPETGWGETRRVERLTLDVFPNVDLSDPRVKWADLSGDGLQDIALVHSGSIDYWPNLGYGNWGKRIHMTNAPRLPYGYNPQRILIGDVDGDGLADIVYVEDRRVTLWINQSGNAWSDPIVIEGTPPITDIDSVRLVDLLGVGTAGVLWSANVTALPRPRMFFLDFTGATKPYLVNEMDNHIGSLTRVAYASSTSFYLRDQQELATQWHTPLPFPVQVVARVEAIDQISGGKLTTEYSYHHGYWDGAEREFRGFGRVDQRDSETFPAYQANGLHGNHPFTPIAATSFSPPTETRTWFHLGPVGDEFGGWYEADFSAEFWAGDPQVLTRSGSRIAFLNGLPRRVKRDALRALRGHILRSELYALDGTSRQFRPYTVTEHLRGVREESPPGPAEGDRLHIFFPFDLAHRTTQWERGDDPMTQFVISGDYDAYGELLTQFSAAVPRGRDYTLPASAGAPYLATLSKTTYAQRDDAQVYCVDRVARSTSYEIVNDGSATVFGLASNALGDLAPTRIIGQSYTYYDGPAFQGLPLKLLGAYGAPVRTETLVLTEDILDQAYRSGTAVLNPPELPPYLAKSGAPAWTADYPPEFRSLLPPLAGYVLHTNGPDPEDAAGYFATTSRQYDFQQASPGTVRGLMIVQRDALGHDTSIVYDNPYQLLPVSVTDPAGLITIAAYDYRVMKPQQVTDPNGNVTSFDFSPLGLLVNTWMKGKAGEGDQQSPSLVREYDFQAFDNHGLPIWVRTIRREYHDTQIEVSLPQRDNTIETHEYSDGFGRLLQTRTQAEDVIFGDPVFGSGVLPADQAAPPIDATGTAVPSGSAPWIVVSGWQIYDNKGKVVEKYESFFAAGWDYASPTSVQFGQKATMYYDPRGLVVRTVNPDGSEQRVVYGIPGSRVALDLTNPDVFEPTPWESYTYDANDNAGRTHPAASVSYQGHWNTPSSITVDALGRTIQSVQRNGSTSATDYVTTSTYDIQGNLLTVTDALGRLAFQYVYDLTKHALRTDNIDAGNYRRVLDAAGNPIEQRDSKGALLLHAYDILDRAIRLWAQDGTGQTLTLRERLVYGDSADSGLTSASAVAANLLGKPYRHYDEAGLLEFAQCDFKGNILEKTRRVISDVTILAVFNPPPPNWQVQAYRVDWQPPTNVSLDTYAGTLLDQIAVYQTSTTYDALNRIETLVYPQDVTGARKTLTPTYNRAGALEHLELDGTVYVDEIAYNAKGQRSLIAYGNGVMTRYAYDPQTFRLARLRSEPYTTPVAQTYHPNGTALQDFAYSYDLVGNILLLNDRTPTCGIPNTILGTDALDRTFSYDPTYRLMTANGRECDTPPPPAPWDDIIQCTDPTLTRAYAESYVYDKIGNLYQLGRSTGATRTFALVAGTNRLQSLTVGATDSAYLYDANGNMVQETSSRNFEWDHSDRMRIYRTQTVNAEPTVHAQYLYDGGGQRVKKLVRKQGGQVEVTVYVDGVFEYRSMVQAGGAAAANNSHHVMDNRGRVALLRVGNPFLNDSTPSVKYQLADYLGSSNVVIDDTGAVVSREEYTPYGSTSFGSFSHKRYRFTGRERDEESGLFYHGARYYAPWLGRWANCDPVGFLTGINPYTYVGDNPITSIDPTGLDAVPPASVNGVVTPQLGGTITGTSSAPVQPSAAAPTEAASAPAQRANVGVVNVVSTAIVLKYGSEAVGDKISIALVRVAQAFAGGAEMAGLGAGLAVFFYATPLADESEYLAQDRRRNIYVTPAEPPMPATGVVPHVPPALPSSTHTGTSVEPAPRPTTYVTPSNPPMPQTDVLPHIPPAIPSMDVQFANSNASDKPDVPLGALRRWKVTPRPGTRGVTDTIRKEMTDWQNRYGTMFGGVTTDKLHAGHQFGGSHVFTLDGQTTLVGAETAEHNLANSTAERAAAERRRIWNAANPNGPKLVVRN